MAGHSFGQEGFPPNSFDRLSLPATAAAVSAAWNHHELGIGFPADKNQPPACCWLAQVFRKFCVSESHNEAEEFEPEMSIHKFLKRHDFSPKTSSRTRQW